MTLFFGADIGAARMGLENFGTFDEGVVVDSWDAPVAFQLSAALRMSVEVVDRRRTILELEFEARNGTVSDLDLTRSVFAIGLQRRI